MGEIECHSRTNGSSIVSPNFGNALFRPLLKPSQDSDALSSAITPAICSLSAGYGKPTGKDSERRYSPAVCTGAKKRRIEGRPVREHVSTSHVERQNLSMRMGMRRFTRLTNAFSKKLENHLHMLSLYFVYYNFCRIHKTLRMSPAMAAGVSDTLRDVEWIVSLIDARAPEPKKRGPYKKQNSN